MFANRPKIAYTAAAAIVAATMLPAGVSFAAERGMAPLLPYELDRMAPPTAPDQTALPALSVAATDAEAQRCIAKVVHHEARNQPHAGMVAVAQTSAASSSTSAATIRARIATIGRLP